jgi:hypothetical protein
MSWFKDHVSPLPRVFVETGTFRGDGVLRVLNDFEVIYSVESDPALFCLARLKTSGFQNVHLFQGDSGEFLENLFLPEPALFYLDAHWSGFGMETPLPLLRELRAISKRPYPDVVVIDDMRLMGKKEWSGEDGTDWPRKEFDFREASLEAIAQACPGRWVWAEDIDRLIIYR